MKATINNISYYIRKYSVFIFLGVLVIIGYYYDYHEILLKRPQSVHKWRQSDCASLALNYYQNGMNFFQPEVHILKGNGGKSGNAATSEIPLLYYLVALLYKIFGYHDFIYRIISMVIYFLGLLYLFKLFRLLYRDTFWAFTLSILFFASPVLVYYGNNFLTNLPALSFIFIAWYYFFLYQDTFQIKDYYLSMCFFFLGSSLKIPAMLSFTALFIITIIETLKKHQIFKKPVHLKIKPIQLYIFFVIYLIIGAWVVYAKYYNKLYHTGYFSTTIFPIFKLTAEQINDILLTIKNIWLNDYFHRVTLILLLGLFIPNIIFYKKINRLIINLNILVFIGTVIFLILWFKTLKNHDYYTINLYILPLFNLLSFFDLLKNNYPKIFKSNFLKLAFAIFVVFNIIHSGKVMHTRYHGWRSEFKKYKDIHNITPYLSEIGIQPLDTVISLPDKTPHTLYLMNLRGWTNNGNENSDSAKISASINRGANYLILAGEDILKQPYLKSFTNNKIGQYNSVSIFKLD